MVMSGYIINVTTHNHFLILGGVRREYEAVILQMRLCIVKRNERGKHP